MKAALVIARDNQAGDALMALPAICALAAEYDRLYVAMTNRAVMEIADFPANVVDALTAEPQFSLREMPVYTLGVAAAIGYRHYAKMLNPMQMMFRWCGLTQPAEVPRPRIKEYDGQEVVPSFDVVLAPFTTAKERTLTVQQVAILADALRPHSVATLGGSPNPRIEILPTFYDRPLAWGAQLLRQAKVVVAVDSFPGRLAHAAGVRNHIVVDSGATPPQTQTYEGAILMPRDDIEGIAAKVLRLLNA